MIARMIRTIAILVPITVTMGAQMTPITARQHTSATRLSRGRAVMVTAPTPRVVVPRDNAAQPILNTGVYGRIGNVCQCENYH